MAEHSKIEWTHHTFNPWWGCARVSPGCRFCYAERDAKRYGHQVWRRKGDRRMLSDQNWLRPLKWNRDAERTGVRARVFCASMADVFEDHPQLVEPRGRLWPLIEQTPWLDWQLLTKRIENVDGMVPWGQEWPSNVWLGTSVEDQRRAEERVPVLVRLPARVRFLSCEPLLGPVRLAADWLAPKVIARWAPGHTPDAADTAALAAITRAAVRHFARQRSTPAPAFVDWVVCGGESGPRARPMHPDWARSLRDQCQAAGVPYFFKQWGEHAPRCRLALCGHRCSCNGSNPSHGEPEMARVGKKAAGRELDGRTWDQYPEVFHVR